MASRKAAGHGALRVPGRHEATLMHGTGDVGIEDVPDPVIHALTNAVVRAVRAAICGSDLHPYRSVAAIDQG